MRKTKLKLLSCLGLLAILFIVSAIVTIQVGAYDGFIFERKKHYGYFNNSHDDRGWRIIPGGVPSVKNEQYNSIAVTDKASFIEFLRDKNEFPDNEDGTIAYQDVSGSAFIVCTMLGQSAKKCKDIGYINSIDKTFKYKGNTYKGRRVTSAGWAELSERVNNPNIEFVSYNKAISAGTSFINSFAQQNDYKDNAFYTDGNQTGRNEAVIGLRDKNTGDFYFRIFRLCANPIGMLKPIPPVSWSMSASSYVMVKDKAGYSSTTRDVYPKDLVKWKHVFKNNGPNAITKDIYAYYKNDDSLAGGSGSLGKIDIGLLANSSKEFYVPANSTVFYEVKDDQVKSDLCQRAYITTKAYKSRTYDESDLYSNWACVNVVNWSVSVSSRVRKTTGGSVGAWQTGTIQAFPGDKIEWEIKVTNKSDSTSKTDNELKYYYINDDNLMGRTGYNNRTGNKYDATGIAPGGYKSKNSSGLIGATPFILEASRDINKTYCRSTGASQGVRGEAEIVSNLACVKVIEPPIIITQWLITPAIEIDKSEAFIGDKVTWTHSAVNTGGDTDKEVTVSATGDGNPTENKILNSGSATGTSVSFTSDFTIPTGVAPETDYCRRTVAQPKNNQNDDQVQSGDECVTVQYQYELDPKVGLGITGAIIPGQIVTVTGYVDNSGTTKSYDTEWKLMVYKNGDLIDGSFQTGNEVFNLGDNIVGTYQYTTPSDLIFGDKICFSLYLNRYRHLGIESKESTQKCLKVGKSPKVQVWGGDIWASKEVTGATSSIGTDTFGSWAEYGVLSKNSISSFGSGGPILVSSSDACDYSVLSFTNVGCPMAIGQYNFTRLPINMRSMFTSANQTLADGILDSVTSGEYKIANDMTISGGNIDSGKKIVLYSPDNTITIADDIKYTNDSIVDIDNIPQVLIIAKNINIKQDVEQIDAWLMAEEEINTCSEGNPFNQITNAKCNKQLVINGPVKAKKIKLYRKFGSDNLFNQGSPAEIINYRADALLWAINRANTTSNRLPSIKSTYVIEQPVRF